MSTPSPHTASHDKTEARRQLRALRRGIDSETAASAALAVWDRLVSSGAVAGAGVVAGYWPCRGELDVLPALESLADNRATALPVVIGLDEPLAFRLWRPGDGTEDGLLGIPVPRRDAAEVVPDALLVPLLGFDKTGGRLGQGGGFYDRTLEKLRALGRPITAIGVGFAVQELAAVPSCAHDQRLDWIVTERFAIRTG